MPGAIHLMPIKSSFGKVSARNDSVDMSGEVLLGRFAVSSDFCRIVHGGRFLSWVAIAASSETFHQCAHVDCHILNQSTKEGFSWVAFNHGIVPLSIHAIQCLFLLIAHHKRGVTKTSRNKCW